MTTLPAAEMRIASDARPRSPATALRRGDRILRTLGGNHEAARGNGHRAAYRTRLAELDRELAEAQEWNDPGRAERIAAERDFLIRELTAASGLGGRARPLGSDLERPGVNVTRAIRSAIRKLAANPRAGRQAGQLRPDRNVLLLHARVRDCLA